MSNLKFFRIKTFYIHIFLAKLNCFKSPNTCADLKALESRLPYSRPIVLQHFPTYRSSDKTCRVHDAPHFEEYREKWEVLSKDATDWLGNLNMF